jgi:hypothetical protein
VGLAPAAATLAFLESHPGAGTVSEELADSSHPANAAFAEAGPDLHPALTPQVVFMQPILAVASEAPSGAAIRNLLPALGGPPEHDATADAVAPGIPKAEALRPPGPEEAQAATRPPDPQTAGLLSGLPVDSSLVDRALQRFVDGLERLGQTLAPPSDEAGLCLWIILGATGAAVTACELARRQYRRSSAPAESDRMPWLSPWSPW